LEFLNPVRISRPLACYTELLTITDRHFSSLQFRQTIWGIHSYGISIKLGFIMPSVKIIAVTGATGSQGGGVVNVMKKTPGWKVRAVTRNPGSEAAKKLAADGSVEVVCADFNDSASLVKAFEV
jgi:hypothetical protein